MKTDKDNINTRKDISSPKSLGFKSSRHSILLPHTHVMFSRVSYAAFATLFLGISLALMLVGSVTFIIGFVIMPWVIGLLAVFHFVAVVSTFSELWRSFIASKDAPCKST
ncbi:hypothetical protein QUC31_017974 [Theobroma cacao]